MGTLTGAEIAAAGLTDWTYLPSALHTRLLTKDYATGLRLVDRIGAAAASSPPDIDLRRSHLDIRLTSYDARGVTDGELALALSISELAAAEGIVATPAVVKLVELALDTPDAEAVRPFWRAVLDMAERHIPGHGAELRDDVLPTMWFQRSGRTEPRQRFHLDLWVAPEVVQARIDAALRAGGVLVSDANAPSFWVLADPEGNNVCLCTWQGRSALGT
jgi:4a-hydroxytetrahydrobiopterin dehydratase